MIGDYVEFHVHTVNSSYVHDSSIGLIIGKKYVFLMKQIKYRDGWV